MKDHPLKANKTAISRKSISAPVKRLLHQKRISITDEILDFGCGRGDDVKHLRKKGFNIWGYDPYWLDNKAALAHKYDVILCSYVLNTVDKQERKDIINCLKNLTKSNNSVYITVRRDVPYHKVSSRGTHQFNVTLNAEVIAQNSSYCIYRL